MNASSPNRADLSALFIEHLSQNGLPVGYCEAPSAGGWDGQPNLATSRYVGYVVCWPLTASQASGPMSDSEADWQVPYQIISYGIDPSQTENQADLTRLQARKLARTDLKLGSDFWCVQQVRVTSIGAMARNDNFDPSEFSQIDVLTLWISKEL